MNQNIASVPVESGKKALNFRPGRDPFSDPFVQRRIVWNLLADVPNRAAAHELAEVLIEMGIAAESQRRPHPDPSLDAFIESYFESPVNGPRWMLATRIVLADFFVQRAAELVFVALGATCLGVVLVAMLRGAL